MTQEEINKARNEIRFRYSYKEAPCSWNELPIEVRKHDYPEYFDKEGNDCYPINQEEMRIFGKCSDGDYIDTDNGILCWPSENGEHRLFEDGDEVVIIVRKRGALR